MVETNVIPLEKKISTSLHDVDLTSLVSLETNVHYYDGRCRVKNEMISRFTEEFHYILDTLVNTCRMDLRKRAGRIRDCCSFTKIIRSEDNEPRLIMSRCKDRMCSYCARVNAYKCSKQITELMRVMPSRRAITLTLQHQAGPLQHQIDRLMDAWKNLRRQQSWKAAVKGGFYSLEITRNNQNGMWHPHLHVIVTGSYYDQKVLSRAWDKASGGSSITYIQAIHDIEKTGNYISKYVTKPDVIAEWKSTVLIEYADAIRGRRLFHTFGTMHNLIPANLDAKLIESKGDTYALPCHIIEGVKEGLPECEEVLFAARAMPKKWRVAFGVDYQLTFEELDETPVPNDDEMHSLLMSATLALDKKAEKPMPEPPTTTHTQLDLDLKTKIPSPARMI